MIEAPTDQIDRYEQQLGRMPKALHFAERNTMNDLAFETRVQARDELEDNMILRNAWTKRSVMVERARRLADPAIVGSERDYLETQEFGGTKTRKGKQGVPLATGYASGEGDTANPRRKLPRARNKLSRLQLAKTRGARGSKRQRNVAAVRQAVATGRREVFIDTGRKQFIARVTGGKRSPRVRMLYDLSRRSVNISRNPWLLPATDRALTKQDRFYAKRLEQQLDRLEKVL